MSDTKIQARLRPVIRVFVSSTFSDMKHERNALEADAFPKLEQLCQRHGFQFQAIDLRWGVSTEAGLDHRTMRICFDEVRRAQEISPQPNFLILLGNRYGWRPLPEEISVAEFHTLEHAAAQIPDNAEKLAVAVLREWYREDTNAVPPVYLLQSRRQDLGDDKDYTHDAVWNQVQAVLWTIINQAMSPEQLQRRFDGTASDGLPPAIVRFQASATEQEIWHGALRVPDAREHVLAFVREIENLPAFSEPKLIKDFVDVDPSGSVEVSLQAEQGRLKEELRQRLGDANIFRNEVPAQLMEVQNKQGGQTADVTTGHLAQLCTDVVSRLSEIIQGQIEEYWHNTAQASTDRAARELEIEQREYERFARERGGEESFVGRQVELQAILDYVGSDSRWPVVIHGASGCGKTALLARASQEVAKTRKRIERFIGVAPRSSDLRSLLGSLCQELRQWNSRAEALPTEIKELRDEFSQHLQAATPERPLILFLDALDQLADADNGRLLNWLPLGSLPAHVKLVVSCLSNRVTGDPGCQPYAELKRHPIPAENFINLGSLSEAEACLLLFDRWLPKVGRNVSNDQRARIEQLLASPACRQPIFLKLLFEEVRLWHSYDPVLVPGESVSALLEQLFDRLGRPTNHGPLLVNRVLGYLSASRHGLAENEIMEILFADPEYRAMLNETTELTRHEMPPDAKRIPIALWSRLRFDLAHYLTERAAPGANVLTFYHHQVAEWVQEHFAKSSDPSWRPHQLLANYFRNLADPERNQRLDPSHRVLVELPFQATLAQRWDIVDAVLCTAEFPRRKQASGLGGDLATDYVRAIGSCAQAATTDTSLRTLLLALDMGRRVISRKAIALNDTDLVVMLKLGKQDEALAVVNLWPGRIARLDGLLMVYREGDRQPWLANLLLNQIELALDHLVPTDRLFWQGLAAVLRATISASDIDAEDLARFEARFRGASPDERWQIAAKLGKQLPVVAPHKVTCDLLAAVMALLPHLPSHWARLGTELMDVLCRLGMSTQFMHLAQAALSACGPGELADLFRTLTEKGCRDTAAAVLAKLTEKDQDLGNCEHAFDLARRGECGKAAEYARRCADLERRVQGLAQVAAIISDTDTSLAIHLAKEALHAAGTITDQYEKSRVLSKVTCLLARQNLHIQAREASDLSYAATELVHDWRATMSELARPAAFGNLAEALLAVGRIGDVEEIIASRKAGDARMAYHTLGPYVTYCIGKKDYARALACARKASDQYGTRSSELCKITVALANDGRLSEAETILPEISGDYYCNQVRVALAEGYASADRLDEVQLILGAVADAQVASQCVYKTVNILLSRGGHLKAKAFFESVRESHVHGDAAVWASALREAGLTFVLLGRKDLGLRLLDFSEEATDTIDNELQWLCCMRELALAYVKAQCTNKACSAVKKVWSRPTGRRSYSPLDMDDERTLMRAGEQANWCAAIVVTALKSSGASNAAEALLAKLHPIYFSYGSVDEFIIALGKPGMVGGPRQPKEDAVACAAEIARRLRLQSKAVDDVVAELSLDPPAWGSISMSSSSACPAYQLTWEGLSEDILSLAGALWVDGRLGDALSILGDCELDCIILLMSRWCRSPEMGLGCEVLQKLIEVVSWLRSDWRSVSNQLQSTA